MTNSINVFYDDNTQKFFLSLEYPVVDHFHAVAETVPGSIPNSSVVNVAVTLDAAASRSNLVEVELPIQQYGDKVIVRGLLPIPPLSAPGGKGPASTGKVTIKFEQNYD